jgi:predicted NAD-dependent protein-ADP-ribosyltransferase YbiA (DUF1768 family)
VTAAILKKAMAERGLRLPISAPPKRIMARRGNSDRYWATISTDQGNTAVAQMLMSISVRERIFSHEQAKLVPH